MRDMKDIYFAWNRGIINTYFCTYILMLLVCFVLAHTLLLYDATYALTNCK